MPTGNFLCIENYTGARCEEVFLPSASSQSKSNLSAAFVALVILVTLTLAALCFLCRSQRSLKTHPVKGIISVTSHRQEVNRTPREGHRVSVQQPSRSQVQPSRSQVQLSLPPLLI
ncbi:pro-neuregulin-4, membrane-bound isoform isoform X3 [Peromyscus maniculatus bairdii]|uniref:pro-neuregulin-4, membrane-bound isoform isoform X3 n=1 Tax=Peromyscus maniculatus bairdii TaxID=230844 RepID=UPI003FD2A4BD